MVSKGIRLETEACRADVLSHPPPSMPAQEGSLLSSASAFAFISNKDISICAGLGQLHSLGPGFKSADNWMSGDAWEN